MRKALFAIITLAALAIIVATQSPFTATSTITIQRRGVSQPAANQSLQRDIERYVRAYAPGVTGPAAKDNAGSCLPFTATIEGRSVNLELYNRDSNCAPIITAQGRTDLLAQARLDAVLERLFRAQFNAITDSIIAQDEAVKARTTAETETRRRKQEEQPEGAQERRP